jgi:hypothetical protein
MSGRLGNGKRDGRTVAEDIYEGPLVSWMKQSTLTMPWDEKSLFFLLLF